MNKRDLKAYSRFDGTGRIVPGSTVLRRQKPKVGNWKEVQAYECCNVDQTPIVVDINGSFPFTYSSIEIGNENGNWYQPLRSYTNLSAADINELAALYNTNFSNLGKFSVIGGDLYLTPSIKIAEFYQSAGATVLYAYAFTD